MAKFNTDLIIPVEVILREGAEGPLVDVLCCGINLTSFMPKFLWAVIDQKIDNYIKENPDWNTKS